MTGFQIIHNSGDIVHTSGHVSTEAVGLEPVGEAIIDLNASQFWFYHHPRKSIAISFFKGYRNVSQQFYGLYEGHSNEANTLGKLKGKVEATFAEEGWSTSESGTGGDAIYTDLDTAQPVPLAVDQADLERIRPEAEDDPPVQLGAPDNRTALQVCKQLVEQFDGDVRVSICGSGVVDNLPPSDFVVVPNTSEEPGELIRGAQDRLDRSKLQGLIDNARNEVEKLIPTTDSSPDQGREDAVAAALEEAGVAESGIDVNTPKRRSRTLEWLQWKAALAGGAVTLLVAGVLLLLYGKAGASVSMLQHRVYPILPGFLESQIGVESRDIVLESWLVILVSVTVTFVTTLDRETIEMTLNEFGSVIPSRSDDSSVETEGVDALVDYLLDIATHEQVDHDEFGGMVQVGGSIFEHTQLEVSPLRDRRIEGIRTMAFWFGVGTVVTSVSVGVVALLALGLSQIWTLFLSLLLILASVTVIHWAVPYVAWLVSAFWKITSPVRGFTVKVWGAIRPRRTYSTRGEVLRYGLGFVVTAPLFVRMAGETWAKGEGLGYQLVVGLALETIGLSGLKLEQSITVFYFTVLGFVLGLVAIARRDDHYSTPASMLFIGISVGVVFLWDEASLSILIERLVPVWALAGGLLAVGFASAIGYLKPKNRRNVLIVEIITIVLGIVIVVALLEQHLRYVAPLAYDTAENQFRLQSANFIGFERMGWFPIDIAVSALILTGLWSVASGSSKQRVLVLSPTRGQAELLVVGLSHIVKEEESAFELTNQGREVVRLSNVLHAGADGDSGSISFESDIVNSAAEGGPLKFEVKSQQGQILEIRTPLYQGEVFDRGFADTVEAIAEGGKLSLSTSGASSPARKSSNRSGNDPRQVVAEEYLDADILVLALPVNDDSPEERHIPPNMAVGSKDSDHYIDVYEELLSTERLDNPQYVFGVGTYAEPLAKDVAAGTNDAELEDALLQRTTNELFGGRTAELHLKSRLDRPAIPFYVASRSDGDLVIHGPRKLLEGIDAVTQGESTAESERL